MIERLREILSLRGGDVLAAASDQCLSPATLANLSRMLRVSGDDNYRRLAWHMMGCLKCARRWELLQSDPHLQIMELVAIARNTLPPGEEAEMLRVRARSHMEACAACRGKQQPVMSAPVAWEQGVAGWLAPRLVAAYRGDVIRAEAVALDQGDRVQLAQGGSLARVPVQLQVFRDTGQGLGINIAGIQPTFKYARIVLFDSGVTESPWADVCDGKASIEFGGSQASGLSFDENQLTVLLKL